MAASVGLVLRFRRGPLRGRAIPIEPDGVTLIGRAAPSHILLPDHRVSSIHCVLARSRSEKAVLLIDARSRRGTRVNGKPFTKGAVHPGDVLTIGPFELELLLAPPGGPLLPPASRPDGQPPRFELVAPRGGDRIPLAVGSAMVVGRSGFAHLRLRDAVASRLHCLIALDPVDPGALPLVIDLRSQGHTFIDGRAVHRKHLKAGEVLTVGRTQFELRKLPPRQAQAPVPQPSAELEAPAVVPPAPVADAASAARAEGMLAPDEVEAPSTGATQPTIAPAAPAEPDGYAAMPPEAAWSPGWSADGRAAPLRRLWRKRRGIGIGVFLAAAAAAVAIAWWKLHPYYEATATVEVVPVRARAASPSEEAGTAGSYAAFFDTQLAMATSDAVLKRSLTRAALPQAPFLSGPRNPPAVLRQALRVERVATTQLFAVSLRGERPGGLAPLVNSVVEAHVEHFHEGESLAREAQRQRLEAERTRRKTDVDTKAAALAQLRGALAAEPGAPGNDPVSITHRALVELQAKRASLKAKLDARRAALDAKDVALPASVVDEAVERDAELQRLLELRKQLRRDALAAEAEAALPPSAGVDARVADDPQVALLREELTQKELLLARLTTAPEGRAPAEGEAGASSEAIVTALAGHPEVERLAARAAQLREAVAREQAAAPDHDADDHPQALNELREQLRLVEGQIQQYLALARRRTEADVGALRGQLAQRERQVRSDLVARLKEDAKGRAAALRRQIQSLEAELQDHRDKVRPTVVERLREGALAGLRREVAELDAELQASDAGEKLLQATLARQMQQRTLAEQKAAGVKALEAELEHAHRALLAAEQALRELNTTPTAPGYVRVASLATEPTAPEPYIGRRIAYSAAGLAAAFALALLAMLLADRLDDRVRTPDDFPAEAADSLLGCVPHWNGNAPEAAARPALFCHPKAPPSLAAEGMRNLMVGLLYPADGRPARTVLVTGPSPDCGKTALAANLAVCLAALRRRVLLVGADLAGPDVAQAFGVEAAAGLSDLLPPGREPEDLIQSTAIPSLSVLPAGSRRRGAAAMLGGVELRSVLERLGSQYDYVLIDGAPLTRPDARILAPLVDGVICSFRAGRARRRAVSSCLAALRHLGARALGVALMGVRRR